MSLLQARLELDRSSVNSILYILLFLKEVECSMSGCQLTNQGRVDAHSSQMQTYRCFHQSFKLDLSPSPKFGHFQDHFLTPRSGTMVTKSTDWSVIDLSARSQEAHKLHQIIRLISDMNHCPHFRFLRDLNNNEVKIKRQFTLIIRLLVPANANTFIAAPVHEEWHASHHIFTHQNQLLKLCQHTLR